MIKTVTNVKYQDLSENLRFDVRYYFLGEIITKILSEFNVKPLSTFTKSIKKGIFDLNSRYYCDSGIPFVRISNLMSYTLDEKGMVHIPKKNHLKEIKTKLVPGDLALSKIGKYLGKIARIPSRYNEVNISQNIVGVMFNCDKDLKNYIFLYLTTPLAINQIIRVSKQHNQNKLTLPDIRNLKIPLLSNEKIKYYSQSVEKISKLEEDSFKLMKEAQKYFYESLEINFSNIKKEFTFTTSLKFIKEESFFTPEYSNPLYNNTIKLLRKFKILNLERNITIKKGDEVGSDNYNLYVNKSQTDIPFIRTSDIVNYEVDNYPDFFISDEIYDKLDQNLKVNDIIFSKDGSIGHIAMITESDKVIISSGFSIIRLKENSNISPHYLFCALSIPEIGIYQAKKRTVVASTIPHLRQNNIFKFEIPILEEKIRVKIDKLIIESFSKRSQRKKELENIKKELEKEFEVIS